MGMFQLGKDTPYCKCKCSKRMNSPAKMAHRCRCWHDACTCALSDTTRMSTGTTVSSPVLQEGISDAVMAAAMSVDEAKELISEMCRNFYSQGWVSGTGGGMSIRAGDCIVMAPSGVQKERMVPEDMFVLNAEGEVLETPRARPPPYKPPKLSECSPLFMAVRVLGSLTAPAEARYVWRAGLHGDADPRG